MVEELEWESRIFGRRMGVVRDVEGDAIRRALEQPFEFLLCKVSTARTDVVHELERNGFLLVETAVHYVFDCRHAVPRIEVPCTIRHARQGDRDAAVAVARAAFASHFGRFHADPNIARDDATRVYEEWIRSSFDGYADAILLAVNGDRVIGFSVWRAEGKDVHYSIGGVDPAYHTRGVFRALTAAGMELWRDRADTIDGPTHIRNLAVQRAYLSLGWELRESAYTFHRWRS